MNCKNLLIAIIFTCTSKSYAQDNQINVSSKINNVTVFLSGAQVQRQTERIDIPKGVSQLVFSGLSSAVQTQSIQAKGDGNFTILSVTPQQNFLTSKANSAQKEAYKVKIETLNDQITDLANESAVYKAEEEMLEKNQTVMGPNVNYDLAKLKLALDFQKQRLSEAKNKQVAISKQLAKLRSEVEKYQRQINEVDGRTPKNTTDIIVKVSADAATKGKFLLTYLVNNASWFPSYDIRATDIATPITLVYKANVSQSSGEDWNNVKLTLSSGNPSTDNSKPNLGAYMLGFNSSGYYNSAPVNTGARIVKGRVTDASSGSILPGVQVKVKNSTVGTSTDANGNYELQVPQGATQLTFSYIGFQTLERAIGSELMNVAMNEEVQQLQEVAVIGYDAQEKRGVTASASQIRIRGMSTVRKSSIALQVNAVEKQTNVVFEIKNPYTILSDGKQFAVEIGEYNFKTDFEYYAAPKISEQVFLTAKITAFNEANLISGEASVFFEGTYLGKTLLDIQNSADTLAISLGTDKNVVIKREKQKDFNERQFIGSAQKDSRSFIIDVKNRKGQPISILIEDQLPISTSSDITIEKQELSKAKLDEQTGILAWQLNLAPNEQKKLNLKYQVKYPKNRPINLE